MDVRDLARRCAVRRRPCLCAALGRRAKEAAGDLDVRIGGGSSVLRDYLAAGLVDQAHLVVVPILLGHGTRLWDGLEALEETYAIEATPSSTGVVHLSLSRRSPSPP